MIDYFWTSVGAVGLLLLQVWLQHEIKARGWTGVTQTLGTIGTVALVIYAILALGSLAFAMAIHFTKPFEYVPYLARRFEVWTVSAAFLLMGISALVKLRKHLMLFLSAIAVWVGVIYIARVFFSKPDSSVAYVVFLANQIEQAHGFMVLHYILLAITTLISMGLGALHRYIVTLTSHD